jgi:hypothetical protein
MITKWKNKLTKIRAGKIWWYNFEYDLSIRNLPDDLKQLFFEEIERQLGAAKNALPLEILIGVLESPTQSFSLKGREVTDIEPLSCVIPDYAFANAFFDSDYIGVGDSEVLKRTVWEMFESGQIDPEIHFKRQAELKSRKRNFFWATLTNSLDKVLSGSNLSATDVRNFLGLSYLGAGVGLYRVDLPDHLPSDMRVCVPTTLDSSPTCVFLPVDNQSHFGQTLHLLTMNPGVEEVVMTPLPFSQDCKVTPIGFIKAPLPDDKPVWCALEERVVGRRSVKTVIKKPAKKRVARPRRTTP